VTIDSLMPFLPHPVDPKIATRTIVAPIATQTAAAASEWPPSVFGACPSPSSGRPCSVVVC
jgi:hypothetical protein